MIPTKTLITHSLSKLPHRTQSFGCRRSCIFRTTGKRGSEIQPPSLHFLRFLHSDGSGGTQKTECSKGTNISKETDISKEMNIFFDKFVTTFAGEKTNHVTRQIASIFDARSVFCLDRYGVEFTVGFRQDQCGVSFAGKRFCGCSHRSEQTADQASFHDVFWPGTRAVHGQVLKRKISRILS